MSRRMPAPRRLGPAWLRVAVAAGLAVLTVFPAAGTVVAADPTFGTPKATSTFLQGIEFSQPVELPASPKRIEVLATTPFSIGEEVTVVDPPGAGSATLRWTLDTTGLASNTPISARWRVTSADGSVVLGPAVSVTYADTRYDWQNRTEGLVRLHFYAQTAQYADYAARMATQGIKNARDLLGVAEKDPVDFYIYDTQKAMLQAMGNPQAEYSAGTEISETRTLFTCILDTCGGPDYALGLTVPHELTHLVFNTATINPYSTPPLWLNEGLAVYLTEGYPTDLRQQYVEPAIRDGAIIPLAALRLNFPRNDDFKNHLAYGEGAAAVDFAIRTYGKDAFVKMVKAYADGKTDAQAFTDAFGVDDVAFEAAWLADLGAAAPQKAGPQAAPANPAFGAAASPAPSASAGASARPSAAPASSGPSSTLRPVATPPAQPAAPTGNGGSAGLIIGAFAAAIILAIAALLVVRRQSGRSTPTAVVGSPGSWPYAPEGAPSGYPPPGAPSGYTPPGAPSGYNPPPSGWVSPAAPDPTPWAAPSYPSALPPTPVPPWAAPGYAALPSAAPLSTPTDPSPGAPTLPIQAPQPPSAWAEQPPLPWSQEATPPWERPPVPPEGPDTPA
jgi:hypothetical protein